jgi:hypothetical protein
MSRLQFIGRPWVVFDAKNKSHRQWFADFQRKSTWGHCPVRFVVADDHGDLITMIQRRLIEFYVDKEFKIVETETKTKRSRQKIKTAV